MHFNIISEITGIETIAVGSQIREVKRLRKQYGQGRWRKLKGIARIRVISGRVRVAELHWYERMASGRKKSNANAIWLETFETSKARNATFRCLYQQHEISGVAGVAQRLSRIADEYAAQDGDIRVVDESGEDYFYPANWFAMVELPPKIQDSVPRAA